MARITDIGWEEFSGLSLEAKRPYLERQEGDDGAEAFLRALRGEEE